MRIQWLLGTVLMAGVTAQADELALTVYLQNTSTADFMTLTAAKGTTAKIFAAIAVKIRWEIGAPRNTKGAAMAMQFDSDAAARFRGDVLAYATPFDESHTCIHVFYNRVVRSVPRQLAAALLGHVMAHEIAHVLERMDRHSAMGVMKAHWSTSDYEAMVVRPLSFEAGNIEAIRAYWSERR